jgi:hypothetical protein
MQGLMLHKGAQLVGRQELLGIETPEATDTHIPIPHPRLVETVIEALSYRKIQVVRDEYGISPDGMNVFGFLEVDVEHQGIRLAIALRNSHNKMFSLGMVAGYRTFICDNLAFSGEFEAIARKHTKHVDLVEVVSMGVDRVQRHFVKLFNHVDAWRKFSLSDNQAKGVIYDAFIGDALDAPKSLARVVHSHYFEPRYEDFQPRTMWSLENAFTSAFAELDPLPRFKATAKLPAFLAGYN